MPNQPKDKYWVYVLICEGNNYYTGVAKDVGKRFAIHLSGRGAKYTRSFPPIRIAYSEQCLDKSSALKREHEIKKLTHKEKAKLEP
ncbi:MAG: GIY-YIG nuclease family protein [bacterium]|nr:GIY-YIG nuclease family protein [Candidatus Microgenomates bacterium CPR3]MCQ3944235.1 GIY-YIG nuclease family protein [bacterium]RIK51756.1 MAG: hypothetical protein DCC61_01615 [Candidatus Microgenomates bacterium]